MLCSQPRTCLGSHSYASIFCAGARRLSSIWLAIVNSRSDPRLAKQLLNLCIYVTRSQHLNEREQLMQREGNEIYLQLKEISKEFDIKSCKMFGKLR